MDLAHVNAQTVLRLLLGFPCPHLVFTFNVYMVICHILNSKGSIVSHILIQVMVTLFFSLTILMLLVWVAKWVVLLVWS